LVPSRRPASTCDSISNFFNIGTSVAGVDYGSVRSPYPSFEIDAGEMCIFMRDDPSAVAKTNNVLRLRRRFNARTWVDVKPPGASVWTRCTEKTNWYLRCAVYRASTNDVWQTDPNASTNDNTMGGGTTPTTWDLTP